MAGEYFIDRRRYFRLFYPLTVHPVLALPNGDEFDVLEISEIALVFRCADLWRISMGQSLQGMLQFLDGETMPLEGRVSRIFADRVVLLLQPHLSTARVFKEQWYLQTRQAEFLNEEHIN